MTFWKRTIVVRVAGLEISAPKISVDIKLDTESTANTGTVTVHNLSKTHEQLIVERGVAIEVDAGYGSQIGRIFTGSVQRVEREREGLERMTKIAVSSSEIEAEKLGGFTMRTYQGAYSVRSIVSDIVQLDMQLPLGDLTPIPESLTTNNWQWAESSREALKNLLKTHGITAYQDGDGVLQFNRAGMRSQVAATITLNRNNGLVETPSVTDKGVRARSLLNPAMRIGDVLRLESELITGEYKITTLSHTGSNWDDNLYTELEASHLMQ